MSKEEVRAWRERWQTMNRITIEDARARTLDERLDDLEVLFASANLFPLRDREGEVSASRARWAVLRQRYCG